MDLMTLARRCRTFISVAAQEPAHTVTGTTFIRGGGIQAVVV
jgi:hypothetical protein